MTGVETTISELLQKSALRTSRSTVMTPLGWLLAIEFAGLAGALKYHAPEWVTVVIVVLLGLCTVTYVAVYVYFGLKSPDALRSERFSLSKMAIERSARGDNVAGLLDPSSDYEEKLLPATTGSPATEAKP